MTSRDSADRGGDAQRVIEALADLFDELPPRDRSAAEEELRADGAVPQQIGARIAQRVAAAMASTAARRAVRPSAPRASRRVAARPLRRRSRFATRVVALTAVAASAVLAWLIWRPQPAPIAMRVPVPSNVPALPNRALNAGVQKPRGSDAQAPVAAAAAPDRSGAADRAPQNDAAGAGAANATGEDGGAAAAGQVDTGSDDDGVANRDSESAIAVTTGEAWILDRSTWEKARDLLPAPVLQRVKTGEYWFLVQPAASESLAKRYPPAFREASTDNAERYSVRAEDCSLHEGEDATPSRLFGFPFPSVDPQSPLAGCQIMWNVEAARAFAGGQEATMTLDSFATGEATPSHREVWLRSTPFLGQPAAFDNPRALRWAQIAQMSAPSDVAGVGTLTIRLNDPATRDEVWTYIPELRRVRKIDPANRSDGLHGSDLALDDLECFDGKLEDFEWRLSGTQTVLAPLTGIAPSVQIETSPAHAQVPLRPAKAVFEQTDASGAPWLITDHLLLVPRQVWLVEGKPRNPYYLYGRVQLFIDATLYRSYWLLSYGRKGELLKSTMCAQHWSRDAERTGAAASATALTSVEERQSRATLARYTSLALDRGQPEASLYTIAKMIGRSR